MSLSSIILPLIGVLLSVLACVYVTAYIFSHSPRLPVTSELKYKTNDGSSQTHSLPTRIDPGTTRKPTIEVSVVIPCYNETKRLGVMFEECFDHLKANFPGQFEIIIVDDKSSDGTSQYAIDLAERHQVTPHVVKVVELWKNRGKGGAVTHGMLHSSGNYILFADADGATQFADITKLIDYLKASEGPAIAIGSRAHMVNTEAVVKRSMIRNFLMYGLHTLVYIFGIRQVQDTQCGFKMFNFDSIRLVFPHMHTERWIFDVEILLLANYQGIQMKELPVSWQEIDGSKVDLVKDSINMAIDLVVTRICYILGIYKLAGNKNV